MEYRRLGKTGRMVSAIGFGAWAIGGDWGTVDDGASLRALHAAAAAGVTLFDTADVYGDGRSERLIGRLLRERSGKGDERPSRRVHERTTCDGRRRCGSFHGSGAGRARPWREIVGLPNTGTGRLGLEAQLRLNGGQLWDRRPDEAVRSSPRGASVRQRGTPRSRGRPRSGYPGPRFPRQYAFSAPIRLLPARKAPLYSTSGVSASK